MGFLYVKTPTALHPLSTLHYYFFLFFSHTVTLWAKYFSLVYNNNGTLDGWMVESIKCLCFQPEFGTERVKRRERNAIKAVS